MIPGVRRVAVVVCGVLCVSLSAQAADTFPSKPIRLLVPAAPGGSADAVTRAVGDGLAKDLGVPVVVENKAGAGGVVATDIVVKAPADGYTFAQANSSHATNPLFLAELPYDTQRDTVALAYVGYIPLVLVTPPGSPYNSVQQVIAAAKANPGSLQIASGGVGSGGHLGAELFKYQAGIDMVHVPFQGNAPALTSVLGGHVPLMFDTISNSLPHITAGKLKVLAISSTKRSPLLPDVPTVAESGLPQFEISAWLIFITRAGTPADVVAKLNASINKAISDPELRARPSLRGIEFHSSTPEQANAFVRSEIERWQKVVRETGIGKN